MNFRVDSAGGLYHKTSTFTFQIDILSRLRKSIDTYHQTEHNGISSDITNKHRFTHKFMGKTLI